MSRTNDGQRNPAQHPRSSYLAAPPLLRATEHIEGAPLLLELPSPVGLLLWGLYRNLSRWLTAAGLSAAHPTAAWGLGSPAEIAGAVETLSQIESNPERIPREDVAEACLCVASWAKDNRFLATCLAFTQCAALVRARDALLAYRVGRMARDLSQYPRAESWLRAAVKLARGQDWETYARAYIALANLYIDVGNYPAARVLANRALRVGARHNIPGLAGMAYHALFIMAAQSGAAKDAHDLAQAAFTHYGPEHSRIPALAHDLACFWSDWGQFGRALPVFQAVEPYFPNPDDHVVVTANRARAAAAVGNRAEYEFAWIEAINTLPECVNAPRIADALLTLARSAASMSDFPSAEEFAQRAHDLATAHGLSQLQLQAESAVEAVRSERQIISSAPSEPPSARETGNRLAGALVLSLSSSGVTSSRRRSSRPGWC